MKAKIKLDNISVYGVDTHARAATIRQWVLRRKSLKSTRIPILQDVSFEANDGDRIAILGMNGSGKSSLLKVISGNYPIHDGRREVEGVVAPIIEMGAGFDVEMTGRRNIKLSYAYRGKLREYSQAMEDRIIEFSEIGDKIDLPLKTYSSGMVARLAFSSAIFQDPDILLLDEIFATGDAGFIDKSYNLLKAKVNSVSIAIMVSHNLNEIMDVCNRCILMHRGRIVASGPLREMHEQYRRDILHLEKAA